MLEKGIAVRRELGLIGHVFFALCHNVRNALVIVCKDHIDSHIEIFVCCFLVICKENVTNDIVFVRFVDHFLVEIRGKELDTCTAVPHGTRNDLPRGVSRTRTAWDMGIFLLKTRKERIVPRHEVDVLFAVIRMDEREDGVKVFGLFSRRFEVDVHNDVGGEFFENVLKGGDACPAEGIAPQNTEVKGAKLGKGIVPNVARAV